MEKQYSDSASNSLYLLMKKTVLTTKEAAKLIDVSLPSIINWADSGQFESFRTPGGHRRIRTKEFLRFAIGKGYPLPEEPKKQTSVQQGRSILIVDRDSDYAEAMKDFLELSGDVQVHICSDMFWAGYLLAETSSTTLILDQEAMILQENFAQQLKANIPSRTIQVVVLQSVSSSGKERSTRFGHHLISRSKSIREVSEFILSLFA